jgi:hypothetical protein
VDDAAHLLHHLGRPGGIHLGTAHTGMPATFLSTGLPTLDALVGGGLPGGRITELAGLRSTGRTSLACAVAAAATRTGALVAWVDPDDALDPETAAGAGLLLTHVLWVRPRDPADALRATDLLLAAGGFGLIVLDLVRPEPARGFARWLRLSRAAERSGTTLLVLSSERRVGTIAALGLEVTARRVEWSRGPGRRPLLHGIAARLTVARARRGGTGRDVVVRRAGA